MRQEQTSTPPPSVARRNADQTQVMASNDTSLNRLMRRVWHRHAGLADRLRSGATSRLPLTHRDRTP